MKSVSLNSVIILEGMKINAAPRCQSLTSIIFAKVVKMLAKLRPLCTVKNAIYTVGIVAVLAMWFHAIVIDNTLDAQRQVAIDALFSLPAMCVALFSDLSTPIEK